MHSSHHARLKSTRLLVYRLFNMSAVRDQKRQLETCARVRGLSAHTCLQSNIAIKGELGQELQGSIPTPAKDVLLKLRDSVRLHLDSLHDPGRCCEEHISMLLWDVTAMSCGHKSLIVSRL